jgi:hypothetical protein
VYINIPLSYIKLFTKDGKKKKDENGNLQEEEEVRLVLRQASVDVSICTSLLVSRQVEEQLWRELSSVLVAHTEGCVIELRI